MPKKIMIIEDDKDFANSLEMLLEGKGYECLACENAAQALKVFEAFLPHIILLDLNMPVTSGEEILAQIKKSNKFYSHPMPVIVISGIQEISRVIQIMKAGACEFLCKPVEMSRLIQAVEKCSTEQDISFEMGQIKNVFSDPRLVLSMMDDMEETEIFPRILDTFQKVLSAASVSIFRWDPKKERLVLKAGKGVKPGLVGNVELKKGERIAGWVAEKGEPLVIHNGLKSFDQFKHLEPRKKIMSSLCLPLKHRGELMGVVNINSNDPERIYTSADMELSLEIASETAMLLYETNLVKENRKNLQEVQILEMKMKSFDQMTSDFLGNVSHELKTPLSSIAVSAELVLSYGHDKLDQVNPLVPKLMDIIFRNSQRLMEMIKTMLDASKLNTGVHNLVLEEFDLIQSLDDCIKTDSVLAEGKKIRLYEDFPIRSHMVYADRVKLEEVWHNLIANAINFTPENGMVRLGLTEENGFITVTIADTGIGVSESHQKHIFDRFYQVDPSVSRHVGGVGLGLFIVREIVEAHGGEVSVQSKEGQGATFLVKLPSTRFAGANHT